jgi:hypothetical protein
MDVEGSHNLSILIRRNYIQGKLCPGLPYSRATFKRRTPIYQHIVYIFEEETVVCYIYNVRLFVGTEILEH